MRTSDNTILITGGGSGIGLAIASQFAAKNNRILITGRAEEPLRRAASRLPNVTYFQGDITDENSVSNLVDFVKEEFPELNILINNAGYAHQYRLGAGSGSYEKAKAEISLNYLAPINLTEKLLPLLQRQSQAAIVNISSIAAYSPNIYLPTYSGSKAALHSYSQIIRLTLSLDTSIKVFEVLPPSLGVASPTDRYGKIITPQIVAEEFMVGFADDTYEIRVGYAAEVYKLMLESPEKALLIRNGMDPQ